ncbi:hypothetical protein [Methanobrevibacter sp. DSM 116169]|uniref:hypothetical protein n=1 Tax=Methanobrevibacter sp. DSM 116169 TaxID=3242727 RepID=UPI0038FCD444
MTKFGLISKTVVSDLSDENHYINSFYISSTAVNNPNSDLLNKFTNVDTMDLLDKHNLKIEIIIDFLVGEKNC